MKKKDNNHIRKDANDLLTRQLRKLFFDNNMNLKENPSTADEDMGIDYYFEVFDNSIPKEPKHLYHIYNQNKGTENLKIISTKGDENFGRITFSLSIRHVEYFYYELDEALLFTICDIKNNTVYWYDIQNDSLLPERINEQKDNSVNSITIYIPTENILSQETFFNLLKKRSYAKYNQIRKKEIFNNLEADYSLTDSGNFNWKMIDKILYTINLFEGIKVFPENVICQLYPFKGTKQKTNIFNLNFQTDSEEFFDFMDSIILENNKLKIKDNNQLDENDKLREVIEFFQINNIYHISWSGKGTKKQICLHQLFHYAECDCERCNLERLNLVKTKELLNNEKSDTNYEYLKRGYTHYLSGNYKESYELFYKIYNDANKYKNPINFTISKYNLIKLRGLIKSFYYGVDREEIINELEKIKFDNDERFIKEYAPYFVDIYKNIKDLKFYDNVFEEVDDSFLKIQKFYYRDSHGGSESDSSFNKLQSSFLKFKSYLHHNFIIFNHYQEYEQLSKKILESLFILHTLKNPETNKYELFDWYALELLIFNIKEEFTTYLFRKYDIKIIRVSKKTYNSLETLVDNLLKSQTEFKKYSNVYSPIRLERIINNITAIITLVDINPQQKENVILKILANSKILLKYNLMPFDGLNFYAIKKESFIRKTTLKNIVNILLLSNSKYRYFEVLEKYFKLCTEKELLKIIYKVLKINTLDSIDVRSVNFQDLLNAFSLLHQNTKDSLKIKFNNILEKDFDSSLYSNLLLYDLIDFDESSFNKLLLSVVNKSDFNERKFPFHSYQNIDLYNVMSIVFKYNLEIDEKIKEQVNKVFYKEKDYFDWLMDIDNYDYGKFNSYWILKSRTKYFTERFMKSNKLKIEIEKSLKVNYIEGVAKMYFKELI